MGKMKKRRMFLPVLLVSLILSACSNPTVPSEETDWRDRYGSTENSTATENTESATKPGEFDISSVELPYPTPQPVREFVPEEGQVELVLWLFEDHERYLDDHIVAELNYILQERGCSFYLSKRVETRENKVGQISLWQEALDSGEKIDLIFFGHEDNGLAYKKYGNTAIIRAITGGYLLPFSEYPETEAKERLLAAYPEDYWRLCSFQGENYGVSNYVSNYRIKERNCLMINLDAAEQAGIMLPEELDIMNLDALFQQAAAAGIPGMGSVAAQIYCGIRPLDSGLYVKYQQDGEYRIVNPMEDEDLLVLWDTLYRYKENGWLDDESYLRGELPLILFEWVSDENWDGECISVWSEKERVSTRAKIYEEMEMFFEEGDFLELLGISSSTQYKEEAVELLSLMHGDEEIVQLLRYGIEGVHYRMGEDGLKNVTTSEIIVHEYGYDVSTKVWSYPGKHYYTELFGNSLMYVDMDEKLGKQNREQKWKESMTEIIVIPYLEDFTEEQKKVQEKVREVTYIVKGNMLDDIASSLISLEPDYQSQIEERRKEFEEAGYNGLAKEVNEKYGLE